MDRFVNLTALLESNDLNKLRCELQKMNVVDIAEFIEELDKERAIIVFRLLPKDLSADVFAYMDSDQQRWIVESMTDKEVQGMIGGLFIDDVMDFLEEVPANVVKRVLRNVDKQTHDHIVEFFKYPKASAASLMTVEFIELHDHWTVKQAFDFVRENAMDKETVDVLYAIDKTHHLTGFIPLYKLITSCIDKTIAEVMEKNVLSVHTGDDRELVAQTFSKYDLSAMPVVDNEQRLVGVITADDIMDVIVEENTEDIEKMAAMTPSEKPYLRTSVLELSKNRLLWLLILMVSATVTGAIINHFDGVLQSSVVLASFIPMLMDTGGNSGSQSSTMIIRGMALGEIRPTDVLKVLWKEFRVSLICGVALATVNFFRILFFTDCGMMIALTVSLSLVVTVIVAKTIGCLLPIGAKICKLDPAVMASPMITTIVDAISLMVYFAFAVNLLNIAV